MAFHVGSDGHHDQPIEPLVGVIRIRFLPEKHLFGRDPDHGVGLAVDVEGLAHRIGGAEQLAGPGRAQHDHRRRRVHVVVGDVAAAAHFQLTHLHELGFDGGDAEALLGGTRSHLMAATNLSNHEIKAVNGVANGRRILELESRLRPLPGGHLELARRLVVDPHQAGTARLAKVLITASIHARGHAKGRHHRGDAEDHTEGLQHSAADVLADLDETLAEKLGRIHAAALCPFGKIRPSTM